jgi:hypothetical protein
VSRPQRRPGRPWLRLVALAGLAAAVRALVSGVRSEIPAPALVVIAACSLVVSVLVLALLPPEPRAS